MSDIALPACFELRPGWLTDADALLDHLLDLSDWEQPTVHVFGPKPQPRLSRWCGPTPYRFSGQSHPTAPWTDPQAAVRDHLNASLGRSFNAVLANWYRSGDDSMGWHSDDDYGHGLRPVIAAISLGVTRDLRVRNKHTGESWTVPLGHGDLFIMRDESQLDYLHSVPKRARVDAPRVSLTYREVVPDP